MAKAGVHVTHAVPGRVRLKVHALKGRPAVARQLEDRLRRVSGMRHVEVSPVTGSVLLLYEETGGRRSWRDEVHNVAGNLVDVAPELDTQALANELATRPEPADGDPLLHPNDVRDFFRTVDDSITTATGGLSLTLIVPLALVVLGARGFFLGERLGAPRWYDLLWFGFATFMMLNAAGVPPARAAEEAAEVAASV